MNNEVLAFVARLNAHDVEGLLRLMTSDHEFIDMAGVPVRGREAMRGAWEGYFRHFPDYRLEVGDIVSAGDRVHFSGNSPEPALWSARVVGGLVAQWRVSEDTPERRAELGLPERPAEPAP